MPVSLKRNGQTEHRKKSIISLFGLEIFYCRLALVVIRIESNWIAQRILLLRDSSGVCVSVSKPFSDDHFSFRSIKKAFCIRPIRLRNHILNDFHQNLMENPG